MTCRPFLSLLTLLAIARLSGAFLPSLPDHRNPDSDDLASPPSSSLSSPPQSSSEDIHYTIQDILTRYKNFTRPQREVQLYDTHPDYDTACIKRALATLLSRCLKTSVSDIPPALRSATAVRLAICEFDASRVSYPAACRGNAIWETVDVATSAQMTDCMAAIEERAQWWTSYSGYYRTVGEVCHYESLPYERDQVWDMFMNVTEQYDRVLDFLNDYVETVETFKTESQGSFEKLAAFMNEMVNSSKLNKETNEFMWKNIKQQLAKMSEVSNSITEITVAQSNSIEQNLGEFFRNVQQEFDTGITTLRDKFQRELELKDTFMIQAMEDTKLGLMDINNLLRDTGAFAFELHNSLDHSVRTSRVMNVSVSHLNSMVSNINHDAAHAHDLLVNISDLLEQNPMIRTILYTSSMISGSTSAVALFSTMFVSLFYLLGNLELGNIFKMVGMGMLSSLGGGFFIYTLSGLLV